MAIMWLTFVILLTRCLLNTLRTSFFPLLYCLSSSHSLIHNSQTQTRTRIFSTTNCIALLRVTMGKDLDRNRRLEGGFSFNDVKPALAKVISLESDHEKQTKLLQDVTDSLLRISKYCSRSDLPAGVEWSCVASFKSLTPEDWHTVGLRMCD